MLSALSLVLCVAMVVAWVRSYWRTDCVTYVAGNQGRYVSTGVLCEMGAIATGSSALPSRISRANGLYWETGTAKGSELPSESWWNRRGFSLHAWDGQDWLVGVPCWLVVISTGVLPAVRLWLCRQNRLARRRGLCPTCGYDLRASKDRCPECGTPIPAQTAGSGKA